MRKMSFMDVGMLLAESRESPKHIAFVALYTLPEGVDEQAFLREFADSLRNVDEYVFPFGHRVKTGRLGLAGPVHLEPDDSIDIDYHVRHSALPKPGRYRELFTLVSRLHGTLLDRHRPLWEIHLIEGLPNRQFAIYQKIHHATMDGGRGSHIVRSMLSSDPSSKFDISPLSQTNWDRYRSTLNLEEKPEITEKEMRNVADRLAERYDTSVSYFNALKRFGSAWMDTSDPLSLPFKRVPPSSINTEITGARRFVAQSWSFQRIRAIGKAYNGTFNDAVLAMCAGGIRRYLKRHSNLPAESLKAMVPVSVRQESDTESSNALAMISADLATNISDPAKRFSTIVASTKAGKDFYKGMSASEIVMVSTAMQAPGMLLGPLGLASKVPAFNTIISNVPGFHETMYAHGARLNGMYPVSMLADGVALNITLHTYRDHVDFGIVACRHSLPQVQRLIDYMEEALVELEQASGLETPEAKPTNNDKVKAAPKKPRAKQKPKTAASKN